MLGGGGGAIGQFPLEQWFYEMPICTRWWTVATVATSILVQCHIITPFQLFYSFRAVFVKSQVSILTALALCTHLNLDRTLKDDGRWRTKANHGFSTVLAPPDYIPILRTPLPRSPLPRLFPTTLLSPPRRIIGPLSGAIFMASPLRH